MQWARKQTGFTIVELLIVVVVIAILAAITIVAYTGIRERATASRVTSTLANVTKKVQSIKVTDDSESYPTTLANAGLPSDVAAQVSYYPNNDIRPAQFCVQTVEGTKTYYATQSSAPAEGTCADNFGIIGWWNFNGNTADSSPSNWPVTTGGTFSPVAGQNGQANGAYAFSNTSVSVTNFTTTTLNGMSMSGWIYPVNNPSGHHGYFGFRVDGTVNFYVLQLNGTNNLECRGLTSSAYGHNTAPQPAVTPNTWNFVTMVFSNNQIRCYVNAVSPGAATVPGAFAINAPFFIGRSGPGHAVVGGRIDDVRLYNRALGVNEIQAMYAAGAR